MDIGLRNTISLSLSLGLYFSLVFSLYMSDAHVHTQIGVLFCELSAKFVSGMFLSDFLFWFVEC